MSTYLAHMPIIQRTLSNLILDGSAVEDANGYMARMLLSAEAHTL